MLSRLIHNYFVVLKTMNKALWQALRTTWKISRLPYPIVTIFGGSRFEEKTHYVALAYKLSHALAHKNISVITGGGPGIMQAANCAFTNDEHKIVKAKTLSITVRGLLEKEPVNKCSPNYAIVDSFFARKWLMMNFSRAFAIFPGGFGTLDEFAELLNLVQAKHLLHIQIVLIGKDYWQPLLDWFERQILKQGLIMPESLKLFYITDDVDEALKLLEKYCQACKEAKKHDSPDLGAA